MAACLSEHVAACPRSGVLRSRGVLLERAAARVCRCLPGGSGRLALPLRATSCWSETLNLVLARQDERRIEVIASGLLLWGGARPAVDTTLVSPVTAARAPRRNAGRTERAALQPARRAKARTYPEFSRATRARLVLALGWRPLEF